MHYMQQSHFLVPISVPGCIVPPLDLKTRFSTMTQDPLFCSGPQTSCSFWDCETAFSSYSRINWVGYYKWQIFNKGQSYFQFSSPCAYLSLFCFSLSLSHYSNTHTHTHTHTHTCTHTHTHIHTHTYTLAQWHTHKHTHLCAHSYKNMLYTHMHTRMTAHTHTYLQSLLCIFVHISSFFVAYPECVHSL